MRDEEEKKLSFKVFMDFAGENGEASGMLQRECFDKWVSTRKNPPQHPHESFRRVLTAHVCGLDGRKPFPKKVEDSLLPLLRRREIWPCFSNTESTIGIRGFRKLGYHEKLSGASDGKKSTDVTENSKKISSRKRKKSDDEESMTSSLAQSEKSLCARLDEKRMKIPVIPDTLQQTLLSKSESLFLPESSNFLDLNVCNLVSQLEINQLHLQVLMLEQLKLMQNLSKNPVPSAPRCLIESSIVPLQDAALLLFNKNQSAQFSTTVTPLAQ